MKDLDDGDHRVSVIVTPLQPPFPEGVVIFTFSGDVKQLAVSREDGQAIRGLLNNNFRKRTVVMEHVDDDQVRLSVCH